MTKQEFIDRVCARSNTTLEELLNTQVVLPCDCGYELCPGWSVVSKTPEAIRTHQDLYGPTTPQTPALEPSDVETVKAACSAVGLSKEFISGFDKETPK